MSKLVPTICKNEVQVMDASYTTGRRRPVVATNAKGEMVVCSKRTARKLAMKIEARLFVRPRKNVEPSKGINRANTTPREIAALLA